MHFFAPHCVLTCCVVAALMCVQCVGGCVDVWEDEL